MENTQKTTIFGPILDGIQVSSDEKNVGSRF